MAVRDVQFNNSGTEFLSASFDRYMKLWDTETGQSASPGSLQESIPQLLFQERVKADLRQEKSLSV